MATFNKKELEKKRAKRKQEKALKRLERKESSKGGGLDEMMAYVDENGNLVDTPPDPTKKKKIDASKIDLGATRIVEDEEVTDALAGKVDYYNDEKGYGFIKDANSENRYFFHVKGVHGIVKTGDKVSFDLERGPKGMNGVNVRKT
jgi:cold shock CspA family protein